MAISTVLRFQHTSLQFSDGPKAQGRDIEALFAKGGSHPIKTGTEAGPDNQQFNANRSLLIAAAKKYNHRIHFARDNWIAIDRDIITPRTFVAGDVFVADGSETVGPGHDSVFATVSFLHSEPGVGEINVAACHYPTKGKFPGDPNHDINRRYADALSAWLRIAGKGSDLAFVAGDFNMPDDKTDFFFGGPGLTLADELKRWQNTGHGAIDGIASYNRDGRVKGLNFRVLDDREFFLNSDHWMCRGSFEVYHRHN